MARRCPPLAYLGARILHAVFISVILVALTAVFGHFVYEATIPSGLSLLRFAVVVLVGSAAFCALGLALSGAIPNTDAAAPIVNAVILPVEFLSGIFIAFGNTTPSWILWVARVFPVRHFALGMQAGFLGTRVQLERRAYRGRLGRRRPAARRPLLPLGATPGIASEPRQG